MLQKGCVVLSSHGRDKGQYMVVLDVLSDGIHVANGRQRSIEHPKRKNPRHVVPTGLTVGEFSMATNRELRRALFSIQKG